MGSRGQWWGEKHAVAREMQQSAEFRWRIGRQVGGSDSRSWSLESVGGGASNGGCSPTKEINVDGDVRR